MEKVFTERKINHLVIKNRIVLPPMVTFSFANDNGFVSEKTVNHYQSVARGGCGLIIVEASAISPFGRLSMDQLGIWDDKFIDGLSKIAKAVKAENAKVFIQLHHAGLKTVKGATNDLVSADAYISNNIKARRLTVLEIKEIINDFKNAALRAKKAGFDGVEIHGAHGYLLTQFFSEKVNRRDDDYGGSFEKRNIIAKQIYDDIRSVDDDLIIGIRIGANENSLDDSIKRAQYLEKIGYDYLSVSLGFDNQALEKDVPESFYGNSIVYGGYLIKKNVNIPVIGVNKILEPKNIKGLIDNNYLDFIAIGRGQLADYNFANKLKNNESILYCLQCQPCRWFSNGDKCPRQIQVRKLKEKDKIIRSVKT